MGPGEVTNRGDSSSPSSNLEPAFTFGDSAAGLLGTAAGFGALAHRFAPKLGQCPLTQGLASFSRNPLFFERAGSLGIISMGWASFRAIQRLTSSDDSTRSSDLLALFRAGLTAGLIGVSTATRFAIAEKRILSPQTALLQSALVLVGVVVDAGEFLWTARLKLSGEAKDISLTNIAIQGFMVAAFGFDRQTFNAASQFAKSLNLTVAHNFVTPEGMVVPSHMMATVGAGDAPAVANPAAIDSMGLLPSRVPAILGPERIVDVPVVRRPGGKLVWFNWKLARKLGMELPPEDRMTPELEKKILDLYCVRTIQPGESLAPEMVFRADMYAQSEGHRGSARAAFSPWGGNIQVKGIGRTALWTSRAEKSHSNGVFYLEGGIIEPIWGEIIAANYGNGDDGRFLATIGFETPDFDAPLSVVVRVTPTRIANLVDQRSYNRAIPDLLGRAMRDKTPEEFAAAILDAHAVGRDAPAADETLRLEHFLKASADSGVLKTRPNPSGSGEVPDLHATLVEIISRQAETSAQLFRRRMMHSVPSGGNLFLGGKFLDLKSVTALPRTGRARGRPFTAPFGTTEASYRAVSCKMIYEAVEARVAGTDLAGTYNFQSMTMEGIDEIFWKAFNDTLEIEVLCATGLKKEAARHLQRTNPETVRKLREVTVKLAEMENPGKITATQDMAENPNPDADRAIAEKGVVDVFGALSKFARKYFAEPTADHKGTLEEFLDPIIKGPRGTRMATERQLDQLIPELESAYREVMEVASREAVSYYDGPGPMRVAIAARAEFEGRPMSQVYNWRLLPKVLGTISEFRLSRRPDIIADCVDSHIEQSHRSVDGLLRYGYRRLTPEGGLQHSIRMVESVQYSVISSPGGSRSVDIRIPLQGNSSDGFVSTHFDPEVRLAHDDLGKMTFEFQVGGKTQKISPQVAQNGDRFELVVEIPIQPSEAGYIEEGRLMMPTSGPKLKSSKALFSCAFASPDEQELARLMAEPV